MANLSSASSKSTSNPMQSRKEKRGFTLVELLVVIGIIALLISILLPALNKARQAAKLTYCLANMRAIAQATLIYQTEQRTFPPAWSYDTNAATSLDLTKLQGPCLWALLTSLPLSSRVRYCPAVVDMLGEFPDMAQSQTAEFGSAGNPYPPGTPVVGTFSYKYSGLIGGVDTNVHLSCGRPTDNGVVWRPNPLRSVPHASETMMYIDYPQLRPFGLFGNRGFGTYADGYARFGAFQPIDNHQSCNDVCPVHGTVKPATNVLFPTISRGTSGQPALTGEVNIAYCDGSVRTLTVTQGMYGSDMTAGSAGTASADSGPKPGYAMGGNPCYLDSTRYDPNGAP